MAVESLSVVESGKNFIRVRTRNQQQCHKCIARSGCGLQLLSQAFFQNQELDTMTLPVMMNEEIKSGDNLKICIDDGHLIHLSLLQYFYPIAGTVIVTVIAEAITVAFNANEIWVILAALLSLAAGLTSVRFKSASVISKLCSAIKLG